MKCTICHGLSGVALTKDGCDYYKCSQCDFLFHPPVTALGTSAAMSSYDNQYWEAESAEAVRREREDCFIRALELLYLSTIGVRRVLDFGCGLGITVQMLRDQLRINAVGVDPYGRFRQSNYLHKVPLTELRNIYGPESFDAIYSVEVFEHLTDPDAAVAELSSLLKPGGALLINTGTQEFLESYDPARNYIDPLERGHVSIYSLKTFCCLARRHGLDANFIAARSYVVLMRKPSGGDGRWPVERNIDTLRSLGDWFVPLVREYIRLVFVEGDFQRIVAGAAFQIQS
jgi:SAM-dependent methyltransferase